MLEWHDVGHAFGASPVIARVTLRAAPGRVTGIVGPSGCGKTTLLHLAAGLFLPGQGAVVNGFTRTAVVFQEPRLLPWRHALDNIGFGLRAQGLGREERRGRARPWLARLGLGESDAAKYPHELSGGMRQRVALGRALAAEPDLLLLDEPFSALDVGLRRDLQDLVRGLVDGAGIAAVFVTHDVAEAMRLCDEVAVLSPAPARIVHRETVARPFAERNAAFAYAAAAELLRRPEVASSFAICRS